MAPSISWTRKKIKSGFEKFHKKYGRYPTAAEVDQFADLPSSRQIQRRFGGLPNLRRELKLEGPEDFTKGEYSSQRARNINQRAHRLEKEVYEYLVERFGKPFVHREYFFTDDRRTRTDFHIFAKNGNFNVDVFFPKDKRNFLGCLNSKMRTYGQSELLEYPVIFLMMNDEINVTELKAALKEKKNKLTKQQSVMTFDEFKEYCRTKLPL